SSDLKNGSYGGALQLDGDGDYVDVNNFMENKKDGLTVSFWSNQDPNDDGFAISKEQSFYIRFYGTNNSDYGLFKIYSDSSDNQVSSGNYEGWNYWTLTFKAGDSIKVYRNGNLENSKEVSLTEVAGNSQPLDIGRLGSSNNFKGSIDEVQIFDRALNSTEISGIYNSQYNRFYPEGNQTFKSKNITTGDNRVNITADSETLNGTGLNASLYESNVQANSGYVDNNSGVDLNGLVGYWHGDGNALDYSGNGNDGTFNGDANADAEGVWNNSFDFDGNGDYVKPTDFDAQKSLVFWVKSNTGDWGDWNLVGKQFNDLATKYGWGIHTRAGYIRAMSADDNDEWYNNLKYDESNIADMDWHLLAMTFDSLGSGATGKLYVDGKEVAKHTGDATPYNPYDIAFGAGMGDSGTGAYMNGKLDEIMVFNRELSAEEIKSLYVTGSTDHKNNGVGVNWTESSSGSQELTSINSTHKSSSFEINSDSNYLLPDFEFNSNDYNFYSPSLSGFTLNTYQSDMTTPELEIYKNTSILEYGEDEIYINWSSSDENLESTIFNITNPSDNIIYQSNSYSGETIINPSELGIYTINLYAIDSYGNENSINDSFEVVDNKKPSLDVYNITVNYDQSILGDFNATDNYEIDNWSINDTTNFKIDQTGKFENNTLLNFGTYFVNVSVNDTSNNINSEIIEVNVIDTPFIVTLKNNESNETINNFNVSIYYNDTEYKYNTMNGEIVTDFNNSNNVTLQNLSFGGYKINKTTYYNINTRNDFEGSVEVEPEPEMTDNELLAMIIIIGFILFFSWITKQSLIGIIGSFGLIILALQFSGGIGLILIISGLLLSIFFLTVKQ
ncbi:MAG: LamG domain-containing protein, partial [bacterium]